MDFRGEPMKHRTRIFPVIIVAALCIGAFFAPWILPWAEAQRIGYVEKQKVSTGTATGMSAFADQLAPNPETGMCLQPDASNRSVWGPCGTTLPAGTPGQIPQITNATGTYTYTATGTPTGVRTGTQTTIGTEWTPVYPPFDPMGTFYFYSCDGECAPVNSLRWNEVDQWTGQPQKSISGTCSSGSDALLFTSQPYTSYSFRRSLWPSGWWRANLRAKVNANGAAIRTEAWAYVPGIGTYIQLFNWTTDAFSNTSYQQISKMDYEAEQKLPVGTDEYGDPTFSDLIFKMYATCSTSTTVDVDMVSTGIPTVRIESPLALERLRIDDVLYLSDALRGKEEAVSGYPGQVVGFVGTGTSLTTIKGPVDREPVISGTPGQFVKFSGTGTSTTTSKEATTVYSTSTPAAIATSGSVGTSTLLSRSDHTHAGAVPITTRSWWVGVAEIDAGQGAVKTDYGAGYYTEGWLLRNSQSDTVYGISFTVPMDYVSGLTVSPWWFGYSVQDATSSHTVRWRVGYKKYVVNDGATGYTNVTWTGNTCGTYCNNFYLMIESPQSLGTFAAGDVVAIYVERLGSDADDTYTGGVMLVGVKFSYTSSL
jgi:hypothetical protein